MLTRNSTHRLAKTVARTLPLAATHKTGRDGHPPSRRDSERFDDLTELRPSGFLRAAEFGRAYSSHLFYTSHRALAPSLDSDDAPGIIFHRSRAKTTSYEGRARVARDVRPVTTTIRGGRLPPLFRRAT